MVDANSPRVMMSGATVGGELGSGVDDADRRLRQRARHGGGALRRIRGESAGANDTDRRPGRRTRHSDDAVAARRVGPHEWLETDDDVR
jgi:hypothetical protein